MNVPQPKPNGKTTASGYALAIVGAVLILGGLTYMKNPSEIFGKRAQKKIIVEIEQPNPDRYQAFDIQSEELAFPESDAEVEPAGKPAVQGAYIGMPLEPIRGWRPK